MSTFSDLSEATNPNSKGPKIGIPPTPDSGRNSHFLEKRVSGPKNPISPRPGNGSFLSKKIPFLLQGNTEKMGTFFFDRKLPFPGSVRATGKGVLGPRTLFSTGNGDSDACLGSGESQPKDLVSKCSATLAIVAAPPAGERQGFDPPQPIGGSGMGSFGVGLAATLLRHT